MGIPKGITLIVGGGFHGKSTLLTALERSIYNHIPGDGREGIVTDPQAMKIRAEEGRCVHNLNLSNYINHLPMGKTPMILVLKMLQAQPHKPLGYKSLLKQVQALC